MIYENLEQRMARSFIDMLPRFVPDEKAPVSANEQEDFYVLIKSLYRLMFDEPLLFADSLHKDDAYPNRFNRTSYNKPGLRAEMKKILKTMDALLQNMYLAGQESPVKITKRQQDILSRLGIEDFTQLPAAWKWMSARPESNIISFSHCLFNKDYPYTSDIYARLSGEAAFRKLEHWMIAQGYQRFDFNHITASDCNLPLVYANPLWGKDAPSGGFEYKIRHAGIAARYEPLIQDPVVLGLCIPNGLKPFLNVFDSMSISIQDFIISHTKKCDGCRYCVQTDKTKTRPLAPIKVNYEQKGYNLCPYFPGYSYCWTGITDALADQLIEMLSFMDRFI